MNRIDGNYRISSLFRNKNENFFDNQNSQIGAELKSCYVLLEDSPSRYIEAKMLDSAINCLNPGNGRLIKIQTA